MGTIPNIFDKNANRIKLTLPVFPLLFEFYLVSWWVNFLPFHQIRNHIILLADLSSGSISDFERCGIGPVRRDVLGSIFLPGAQDQWDRSGPLGISSCCSVGGVIDAQVLLPWELSQSGSALCPWAVDAYELLVVRTEFLSHWMSVKMYCVGCV